MSVNFVLLQLFLVFVGFAVGRLGDKWGGHLNTPHHWIYGLIFIIVGLILLFNSKGNSVKIIWGYSLISLGLGHFMSDFQDFLDGKVFGVDEPHSWKFWAVD